MELGGLAVLSGSHRRGFLDHREFPGQKYAAFGLGEEDLCGPGLEWRTQNFAAGDFLVFHSWTIHKAMPNLTGKTLRLSTDNRYQLQGQAHSDAAISTHHNL